MIESLVAGFVGLASMQGLILVVAGVVLGIVFGAMPGLSPSTSVALLVPFSYTLDPTLALAFLTCIYLASNYGGSITAVLINTPGTPASAVTAIDGYALTQRGQAAKAMGMSLWASTIGGVVGVVMLILFSRSLAQFAIRFTPADYFALAFFGLSTIASLGRGNVLKALVATSLGLAMNTVGMDPISGVSRFTFGFDELYDGFQLVPVLIGLFAVSVVYERMAEGWSGRQFDEKGTSTFSGRLEVWKAKLVLAMSSVLGTVVGVFPGAGSTIASFLSYDFAKKLSKTPEKFGSGSLEGIAASESANSASVGGALVPLLALGIPGSATDAVLLGAFMLHNLNPGPQLFSERPDLVYGIFAALLLANLMVFILGSLAMPLFRKVVLISESLMTPMILMLAIVGSYAVNASIFDVGLCLSFGLLGWVLKRFSYPIAPIVLGLVLGKMMEENLRRALLMNGFESFWSSPLSLVFIALSLTSFLYPIGQRLKNRKTSI
ncbi:C4-dicarboxylate ABC transporter permease [bacterium]|nr:C4-dicarboxylate ABC transporter permease [bacterium]